MTTSPQPMSIVPELKRKATSSESDTLQDAGSPIIPKKTKPTTVPPSPIPPRTVGYHRFLDRKPNPFTKQRYHKTGTASVHSAAMVCHNILYKMFPESALEAGEGQHRHMTPSAMESAFKDDIIVNNSNMPVMLFLLNAQAMDLDIILPN